MTSIWPVVLVEELDPGAGRAGDRLADLDVHGRHRAGDRGGDRGAVLLERRQRLLGRGDGSLVGGDLGGRGRDDLEGVVVLRGGHPEACRVDLVLRLVERQRRLELRGGQRPPWRWSRPPGPWRSSPVAGGQRPSCRRPASAFAELTAAFAWEIDRPFEAIVSLSDCLAVESWSSACLTESCAEALVAAVGPAWSVASLALARFEVRLGGGELDLLSRVVDRRQDLARGHRVAGSDIHGRDSPGRAEGQLIDGRRCDRPRDADAADDGPGRGLGGDEGRRGRAERVREPERREGDGQSRRPGRSASVAIDGDRRAPRWIDRSRSHRPTARRGLSFRAK